MPRLVPRLAGCLLATTVTASAYGQDIAPPKPMDPSQPGAPGSNPVDPQATQTAATQQDLDKSEQEDSGRNFELVWADLWLGGSYINMSQFSSETLGFEKTDSAGPMFSLGAGLRFVVLVLGARLRYNALSAFNMWQINGEAGLKFPISKVDIYIGGHGGYSFVGSLSDTGKATDQRVATDADAVKVRGFNAGLDFAVDYYITPNFSLGGGLWGDFLFLNRPPVDKPAGFDQLPAEQQAQIANDPLYARSGATAGMNLGAALRAGLHFGL